MDQLQGNYTVDYNILSADKIVKDKLLRECANIEKLKMEYYHERSICQRPQTSIQRKITLDKISKLEEQIAILEKKDNYNKYIQETEDILKEYSNYQLSYEAIIDENHPERYGNNTAIRFALIERYLRIAKKYIKVDITRIEQERENICQRCSYDLSDVYISEIGEQICPSCLVTYHIICRYRNKSEMTLGAGAAKEGDCVENIKKALLHFQAKEKVDIPPEVYQNLDIYFTKKKLLTGSDIKKMPLDSMGRRGNTNFKMMLNVLSATGHGIYHKHARLICKEYWGWEILDLEQYKSDIIRRDMLLRDAYNSIPLHIRKRKSALGRQYRLFRYLQMLNLGFTKDDFKIAEDSKSLEEHFLLWKTCCEIINDPIDFPYIEEF
jgi:hypothetical protein